VQRRVLPDGRVVTVVEDPQRMGDADEEEDPPAGPGNMPGMMRPPFNAPPRGMAGQADDATAQEPQQPGQAIPTTATAPGAPVTVPTPGVLPSNKPAPAPPGPIKPPGD
jgi:hypothetical protein